MKRNVKMFKQLGAATKYAKQCGEGAVRMRVAGHYVVIPEANSIDHVEIIADSGVIVANVGLGHLLRLGNANWAKESVNVGGKYEFTTIPGTIGKQRITPKVVTRSTPVVDLTPEQAEVERDKQLKMSEALDSAFQMLRTRSD